MKKSYALLLCSALAVSLWTGCSSGSEQRKIAASDNSVNDASSASNDNRSEADSADTSGSDSNDGEDAVMVMEDEKEEEKTTAAEDLPADLNTGGTQLASIEPTVLMDQDGIRIIAKELSDDTFWGLAIKLEIENNSDQDIGVGLDSLVVNNYMVSTIFSAQVSSGKKSMESITLLSDSLTNAGIDDIGEIAVKFRIYNPGTFMTEFESEEIVLQTDHYDQIQPVKVDDGVELVNQDGIRIVGKYLDENSIWGNSVVLFLENHTSQNLMVQCDDVSVNGYMVTALFSSDINAGRMAVDDITLLSSDLEEAGIDTVSDIELKFRVIDRDQFTTLFTTESITFNVE